MGLFNIFNSTAVPDDALNIDCWGIAALFLETTNGFITKKNYTPDNMDYVTAFLIGGSSKSQSYHTRIDLMEVAEMDLHPKLSESLMDLTNLFGLSSPFEMTLKMENGKTYKFNCIGDSCGVDEIRNIIKDSSLDDVETFHKLIETSCLERLSFIIDHKSEIFSEGTLQNSSVEINKEDVIQSTENNKCPKCGELLEDDYVFCSNCGFKLNRAFGINKQENPIKENKKEGSAVVTANHTESEFSSISNEGMSYKDILQYLLSTNKKTSSTELLIKETATLDGEIFAQLQDCHYKNDLAFDYWVYKVEDMEIGPDTYSRISLFNRLQNNKMLSGFSLLQKDDRLENYTPKEVTNGIYECTLMNKGSLCIPSMIVDGQEQKSSGKAVDFKRNVDEILLKAMKAKYKNIRILPSVEDDYWQCACGRIHNSDDLDCACGKNKSVCEEMLADDYDSYIVEEYLNEGIEFDSDLSFDENIENYINKFSKQYPSISAQKLKEKINVFEELDKYNAMKGNK